MKPYRFTILMAAILGGLGAYVYFVEVPDERMRVQRQTHDAKLIAVEQEEIRGVTVASGSTEVTLELDAQRRWNVTAPIQAEADSGKVGALLRALVLGKVSRPIEENSTNLAPFGLDNPSTVVTVWTDRTREVISLGDSGPISSTLYALRGSDQAVVLTTLAPKDFLNKTLMTFRKKRVLDFEVSKVQRLRLTYPQSEFVIYRVAKKGKDKWRIRSPIEADADQSEISSLLFKLQELRAIGFIDAGAERQRALNTLKTPRVTVTLRVGQTDHTVKLFQPDPATGEAFAMTQPEAPVYRISPVLVEDLTKDLFAVRNKRLLGIDGDDVAILEVKTRQAAYVLVNQKDAWILEDQPNQPLDAQTAKLFVSRVVNLPAELQVRQHANKPARYGLASPAAEFIVRDRKGRRARLALGKREGGLVYGQGDGLPGIYQARSDILKQIPTREELLGGSDPA